MFHLIIEGLIYAEVVFEKENLTRIIITNANFEESDSTITYHVPQSFLKPIGNLLVLLEEEYGNPLDISIDTISFTKVCGHASESSPPSMAKRHKEHHGRRPKVHLHCPSQKNISKILFASFGTPSGDCGGGYSVGSCHAANSKAIVEKACVGKSICTVAQSYQTFGGDPCPGSPKDLVIDAQCD